MSEQNDKKGRYFNIVKILEDHPSVCAAIGFGIFYIGYNYGYNYGRNESMVDVIRILSDL